MSDEIQVKLVDGSTASFTKFVVKVSGIKHEEFDDYEEAEKYLSKLEHERLKIFMLKHFYYNKTPYDDMLSKRFISWYSNLDVFDKNDFIKLLQKVHKVIE